MLQNQVRRVHPGSTASHEQALRPAFLQTSILIAPMTGPARSPKTVMTWFGKGAIDLLISCC